MNSSSNSQKTPSDAPQGAKVLVTGGGGYIGSHAVAALIEQGYEPIIIDNWCNSNKKVLKRIEQISGYTPFHFDVDLRDAAKLKAVVKQISPQAVIHFAGLKAVGESHEAPLEYYANNVIGTLNLIDAMTAADCFKLVFSSSATVYGDPQSVPISESAALHATNPYGRTKLMIEDILRDLALSNPQWQCALLRYFNPAGAHRSGLIGEDPSGIPNNLIPFIAQVAIGRRAKLGVFGDDYPTPDGTGVRDYIHVVDLASAHLKALEVLNMDHGCVAYNIGTGQGCSVFEMVRAFERASGKPIPFSIEARRKGDIATCYADVSFANKALQWKAQYGLKDMMQDHWRWQQQNPNGYES